MPAKKSSHQAAENDSSQIEPTGRSSRKSGPSTDEIAEAAYLIYRRRTEQGLPGSHETDWLEAEQELTEQER